MPGSTPSCSTTTDASAPGESALKMALTHATTAPKRATSPPPLMTHHEGGTSAAAVLHVASLAMEAHHSRTGSIGLSPTSGEAAAATPPLRPSTQPRSRSSSPPSLITDPASLQALTTETASAAVGVFGCTGSGAVLSCSSGGAAALLGTSKAAKKHHQRAAGTPHTHRRAGGTGASAEGRSAAERCKAARALAAELMSTLMAHPPEAGRIAQYRASIQFTAPTSSSTASAASELSTSGAAAATASSSSTHVDANASATGAHAARTSSGNPTHSFLEAVRNGRLRTPQRSSPGTPLTHPKAASSAAVSPSPLPSHAAPSTHGVAAPQRSASPAAAATPTRRPLELVPDNTAAVPQLLSVLREIALSCATLDTLGRTSSASLSTQQQQHARSIGGGGGGGGSVPVTPAAGGGGGGGGGGEVDSMDEEHWQRVRAHFEVVRGLVLNEHELACALDDALGAEWRGGSTSPDSRGDEEEAAAAVATISLEDGRHASSSAAVVPVMPTPVDRETPPTLPIAASRVPVGGGWTTTAPTAVLPPTTATTTATTTTAAAASPSTTAATPTTTNSYTKTNAVVAGTASAAVPATTLNHKARPFRSRTPPTAPQNGGVAAAPAAPNPVTHLRAGSATSTSATAMAGRQLESGSPRSAAQQLSAALGNVTPPPPPSSSASRTQDDVEAGLLNFPSTPLSEAAAPYQPSASLLGTSPRGGVVPASSSPPFHLESREEMLRRRSTAPNAFYASMTHGGTTHYLGGAPSAATTPGTYTSASLTPGLPPFSLNGGNGGAVHSLPISPLMSYSSPLGGGGASCPYEYLLVLDFEATCEEHPPPNYLYEIIEFPVVVVDVRLQRVVGEFHRFVRPRYKRELSRFCKDLTGMRQVDVDAAASLEEVIVQFERWFAQTVPPHTRCVFATDGPMDLREFMLHHSVSRQGIRFPPLFYQFVDVKQTFACFFQCAQGKIKAMLEVLHLPFEGRLHSGLDDARNIASIVIRLLHLGCTFCEVPLNRLPFGGHSLTGASSASMLSAPLALPPSTASAAPVRTRGSMGFPMYISAPYSVDEDDHTY
ncbi:Exonuclease [Novymonas esmeraldas]|uniref:Exonuclease n=1 Tax=Novymonas esmeraldas TaxID=1808958 RepID=A0AAW0EPX6_9TRYP